MYYIRKNVNNISSLNILYELKFIATLTLLFN